MQFYGSRLEPPLLMMEEAELQQQQTQHIVSWCMGKKRMKRKRKTQLPEDIIYNEILTRLPAKYLVRFRLVCQSWKNLFSTPEFIKSHLNRLHSYSYQEEDLIVVRKDSSNHRVCIVSHSNEIQVHAVSRICHTFLGSIDGLVCMSSERGHEFCLWNPATGQLVEIYLPLQHSKNCRHVLGGLTWDHQRNDYKVMVVCYDFSTKSLRKICVYSSNSASWTEVDILDHSISMLPDGIIFCPVSIKVPSTIVKGIPYWCHSNFLLLPGKNHRRELIQVYKFVAEINEFRLLPLFDSVEFYYCRVFNLVNIKDCLVGMAYDCREYLVDIYSLDKESRDGAWSKMYTMTPIILPTGRSLSECYKNGGENFSASYAGPLSVYDPKIKETAELAEFLMCVHCRFKKYFNYTPSLVCVQGMKSMLEFSRCTKSHRSTLTMCSPFCRWVSSYSDCS